jgi:hypothetical protein
MGRLSSHQYHRVPRLFRPHAVLMVALSRAVVAAFVVVVVVALMLTSLMFLNPNSRCRADSPFPDYAA